MKYMCNRIFLMPLSSSTPSYMGLMIIIIHTHQCGNSGMNFQESSKRPLTGVYILPQNWVFYKSLFGGVEFFMVRNANFGLNLVVFEQKIWVFIKWTQFFIKYAKNGSFFINMNIGINGRIYTPGLWHPPSPLIFGKLCCNFFKIVLQFF